MTASEQRACLHGLLAPYGCERPKYAQAKQYAGHDNDDGCYNLQGHAGMDQCLAPGTYFLFHPGAVLGQVTSVPRGDQSHPDKPGWGAPE